MFVRKSVDGFVAVVANGNGSNGAKLGAVDCSGSAAVVLDEGLSALWLSDPPRMTLSMPVWFGNVLTEALASA